MSLVFLNLFIAVLVDEFQVSFEQAKYKESASASEQKNFLMAIDNMNLSEDERWQLGKVVNYYIDILATTSILPTIFITKATLMSSRNI